MRMGTVALHAMTFLGWSEDDARSGTCNGLVTLAGRPDLIGLPVEIDDDVSRWAGATAAIQACATMSWAKRGFPTIRVRPAMAAAFMLTDVPPAALDQVRLPWDSFAIDVPPGVVGVDGDEVRHVVVWPTTGNERCRSAVLYKYESGRTGTFGFGEPTDLASEELAPFGYVGQREDRVGTTIRRLVLGVCIELSGYPPSRLVVGKPKIKPRHGKRGTPEAWFLEIARDVKTDCREEVIAFLRGGDGASPKVQSFVRGHWKRQPCGPRMANRMWVHIEPYWRGPEDAPIAVRSHEFVDTRSEG